MAGIDYKIISPSPLNNNQNFEDSYGLRHYQWSKSAADRDY